MTARVDHTAGFRHDVTVESQISLPINGRRVYGRYSTFARDEQAAALVARVLFTCSLHGWEPRG